MALQITVGLDSNHWVTIHGTGFTPSDAATIQWTFNSDPSTTGRAPWATDQSGSFSAVFNLCTTPGTLAIAATNGHVDPAHSFNVQWSNTETITCTGQGSDDSQDDDSDDSGDDDSGYAGTWGGDAGGSDADDSGAW